MREAFHEQLDAMFGDLASICENVETAVRLATEALLSGDATIAEDVISADAARSGCDAAGGTFTAL